MPDQSKPQIQLDNYTGPLDLLLGLIEQQRLDITAISLAKVAEQYMAAVASMQTPEPDTIAEFLVIGAKLLVIKTRALLPRPPAELLAVDDELSGDDLARQLQEYQRFKAAAQHLRAWDERGNQAYTRQAEKILGLATLPPRTPPVLDIGLADLVAAMQRRLQLLIPLAAEPTAMPVPKIITIADVRERVRDVLDQRAWTTFDDLLGLALTRNEVIVTLWTVLELFKRRYITIEQHDLFGSIAIGRGDGFTADPEQDLVTDE